MKWSREISNGIAYYSSGNQDSNHENDKTTPIVFVHGVGLRAESWYQQVSAFNDRYRCYVIDMPGHGESDLLPNPTLTLEDFAAALNNFIQNVVGEPAIIVGHSLGAMTALQTAVSYPKIVRGVAAFNAIYNRPDNAAQDVQTRAESLLNDLEQNVTDKPIARWFDGNPQYDNEAELCRSWLNNGNRLGYAQAYQMFAHLRGIPAAELKTITVPALLLTGEMDINSSAKMSLTMADILPNANAVIVPEARHMTQMTHANAVNSALERFFAQCDSHHTANV
ncbi:alpha/beta fold hydrolase [Psychrobacter alimentarius]|uniref:Alpha/beta hydrolase n=1 Tax=Psychrobacter alimentarius TaxID=261164 RepID=A0ABM5ZXX4_9GAMM|nr:MULTISPECIES: alpha/beta hydrolase [Psychrobacter]AMT96840.1 Alpha/beta hydrolase [Psychrobacter alimentarius]PAT63672.1 alpha/beta hydrolase [Psychrobacter sp. JB193]QCB30796.1 alpha/beta hydrolase [Psychrobacter sp. PAMC27889]